MSLLSMCQSTGTIQHNVGAETDDGSYPESWTPLYTGVPMRVGRASAREQERWAGLPVEATDTVYIPCGEGYDLDAREDLRIVVNGRTLDVLGVRNVDEVDRFYTLACREVR